MSRIPWGLIIALLLVLAICGMAMHVTAADNACPTDIDWLGRCLGQ